MHIFPFSPQETAGAAGCHRAGAGEGVLSLCQRCRRGGCGRPDVPGARGHHRARGAARPHLHRLPGLCPAGSEKEKVHRAGLDLVIDTYS